MFRLKMILTLYITDGCPTCKKVKNDLTVFVRDKKNIRLKIEDIQSSKPKHCVIVPALFINNDLYSYGEVDMNKLKQKLKW